MSAANIYDMDEPVAADGRPTLDAQPARSRGMDFAKLNEELRAGMTPEQRARADAADAERKALEAATKPIASQWAWTRKVGQNDEEIIRQETREIGMRIEPRGEGSNQREVLHFIGGPTGNESYTLDIEFANHIANASRQSFIICWGRAGDYPRSSVKVDDVIAFLDNERPLLMATGRGLPLVSRAATPLGPKALMQTLEQAFADKRVASGLAQHANGPGVNYMRHKIAGQVDGLQWMIETLHGKPNEEMRPLLEERLDILMPPPLLDNAEATAFLSGQAQVLKWGQALIYNPAPQQLEAEGAKNGVSSLLAPQLLGSAGDVERMRPTLRLTEVWKRSLEAKPGDTAIIITATWGKDHDSVVSSTVPKMKEAEAARNEHQKSRRRGPWIGLPFEATLGSRLDNELIQPLKALAASTNRSILVALGDKPVTQLPGIIVSPDGTLRIGKAFVQDPANRVRAAEETVPGYSVTTLAEMEQTLKGPARGERLDVTIVTQGKTPAYDRASYEKLPDDHAHKVRIADEAQPGIEVQARAPIVLDLTRSSPFNTPTRVDRVAWLNEANGKPEWIPAMPVDQAGVLCNHIRNELRTNPDYAIALAKVNPTVVLAASRAEAFVMAAAADAVTAYRPQVLAMQTQMMDAFDTERPAQVYIGDQKELQASVKDAVVAQFDASIKDLSNSIKLPMQEEESGVTGDGDVRSRRYQTSAPPGISHPQVRFSTTDLAIMAEDAKSAQDTVEFVREGLSVKARLQGTDVSVPAKSAFGTMLLRQPEGVIAQASMADVMRAASRPGSSVTLDLAAPAQDWGRHSMDRKRAAER